MTRGDLAALVEQVAAVHPSPPSPDDGTARALRLLAPELDPEATMAAGQVAAVVLGTAVTLLALLLGADIVAFAVGGAVALAASEAARRFPTTLLALRRTRAAGDAADLICRLVMRLRVAPTVEGAVAFAGRTGDDPLSRSLEVHARRARGTPHAGLSRFAEHWAEWCPALPRAAGLVEAAAGAEPGDRGRAAERALATTLSSLRERTAKFAADVRGPATGLYAFGVLLPLALLAVMPAARTAGVRVPLLAFAIGYDVVLPLGVGAGGLHILTRRPAAFPPPAVDRSHPNVPNRPGVALAAGAGAGLLAGALAGVLVAPWATPVAAAGAGVGTALVGRYHPVKAVRDEVRAVERGLPDAVALVGRRVGAGVALEAALGQAAAELDGPAGDLLAESDRIGRTLGTDVRGAFFGEHGALATVPSARVRGVAALLALAAREGQPAGDVLVGAADHLAELGRVERAARRDLATVTTTLGNTAGIFGPLVGGVTVALAARLARANGEGLAVGYATAELGLVVGGYVLGLAAVLAGLAGALTAGLDRAVVGYRVGIALPTATATYLTAVVGTGLLV